MLVPTPHIRDIIMLNRISFAIADDTTPFSHFIDNAGMVAHIDDINGLEEAKVGIFTDFGPMTEAQAATVLFLAERASVRNLMVEIVFGPGTSPFMTYEAAVEQLVLELI